MEIPLEYFAEGIAWLKSQVSVLGDRVAIVGASRGGELSLLLGSVFPDEIAAVVAKVPSGVIWGGIGREAKPDAVAWTYEGRAVAPLAGEESEGNELPRRDGAIVLTPAFEERLASASAQELANATIPIERFGGPVLLLSGEDDAMWPSVALSEIVVERGVAAGQLEIRHLHYRDAGTTSRRPRAFPSLAPVFIRCRTSTTRTAARFQEMRTRASIPGRRFLRSYTSACHVTLTAQTSNQ